MDLEGIMLSELRQTETDNTIWFHLFVDSIKNLLDSENRTVVARGEGIWGLGEIGDGSQEV